MVSVAETLQKGLSHHQSGRLNEAESIYRNILRVDPEHADSLHLLGVVAHQRGRHEVAQVEGTSPASAAPRRLPLRQMRGTREAGGRSH